MKKVEKRKKNIYIIFAYSAVNMDKMSFSQGAVQHSTGLFLHGVCAVETAESVWSDRGVAGEAQEGGALRGTHLVNGSDVVFRAGGGTYHDRAVGEDALPRFYSPGGGWCVWEGMMNGSNGRKEENRKRFTWR